jgi:transposase-like protein
MTASPSIDLSGWLSEQLTQASPDLLREMLSTFVQALMGAQADAVCGAEYGVRSSERSNTRNGYRRRDWDTRAGTIELAIPKLRSGSYFPDWLLERRRRAEAALVSVVATSYLLGVSTRRMEKLVETLGIGDGQGSRRAGRGVPHATVGRRPIYIPRRRRAGAQGP